MQNTHLVSPPALPKVPRALPLAFVSLLLLTLGASVVGASPAPPRSFVLPFVENEGQWPEQVHFGALGQGHAVWLEPGLARIQLPAAAGVSSSITLRVRQAAAVVPQAESRLTGRLFDYRGTMRSAAGPAQPAHWTTFDRVRYAGIRPGVDWIFHQHRTRIEYDFELAPGVDPDSVEILLEGGRSIHVDERGRLHVETGSGQVVFEAPITTQEQEGETLVVHSSYRLLDERSFGFAVGDYDERLPLVIDPVLLGYSSRLGGEAADEVQDMHIADDGSILLTGQTQSSSFVGQNITPAGGGDAFVAKLAPDGQTLVFAAFFGGTGFDLGWGVTTDANGNVYVAGQTESTSGIATAGAYQASLRGMSDAFLVQLDPNGSLLYGTYYGGDENDGRFDGGIGVHSSGRVYFASRTDSSTTLPLRNAHDTSCNAPCALVAGFDPSQSGDASFVYGGFVGGNSSEGGLAFDVDASERLYVFGFTGSSADLVVPGQGFQDATGDTLNRDHFLVVLDPALSGPDQAVWSSYLGGLGDESEEGDLVVGAGGLVWLTSQTTSTAPDFPIQNAYQPQNGGVEDAYVAAIDTGQSGASSLLWSTFLGGSGPEAGRGIDVDSAGRVFIGLGADLADFDSLYPLPDFRFASGIEPRAAVVGLSADGQSLLLSTPIQAAQRLAVDPQDRVLVAGNSGTDLFPLVTPLEGSAIGLREIFLARLDPIPDRGLGTSLSVSHAPAAPGEVFAIRQLVLNGGDPDATDVTTSLDFPAGLDFDHTSAGCSFPGATSDCELFEAIPHGTLQPIYTLAHGPTTGSFALSSTATGSPPDADPGDNTAGATAVVASTGLPAATLELADFDVVAFSANQDEFALDTPAGVLATANGVDTGSVNLMTFEGAKPVHIVELLGMGEVAFGFVERNDWTPAHFDNADLFGESFSTPCDRVFARVDSFGIVTLMSAAPSRPGRVVARGAIALDRVGALSLEIDSVASLARVRYDGEIVVEGDPFTSDLEDADPLALGDDQVISVGFGTEYRGAATLNTVPEPGSALGLPMGSAALALFARRRRSVPREQRTPLAAGV